MSPPAVRRAGRVAARVDEWVPLFVLDPRLLDPRHAGAPRLHFLLDCLAHLDADLARHGCPLVLRHGDPAVEIPKLAAETGAEWVVWNRDVTPFARARDARVRAAAGAGGARALDCADRVIFESRNVLTAQGRPFAVYTPYRRAWHARCARAPEPPRRTQRLPGPVPGVRGTPLPAAPALGAEVAAAALPAGGEAAARRRLERFLDRPLRGYADNRNRPAADGTSRLSPDLRFGTISPRACVAAALARARADRTGYPIVDAGMRQLSTTGWRHNRVRMITASFLTKDLLIDWRWGAAHFQRLLIDADPASNNGGGQWAASTGTDAQPWFRIFDPTLQGERFDPRGTYVRRFVPELAALPARGIHRPRDTPALARGYPPPIVDHAARRVLAPERFAAARRGRRA